MAAILSALVEFNSGAGLLSDPLLSSAGLRSYQQIHMLESDIHVCHDTASP